MASHFEQGALRQALETRCGLEPASPDVVSLFFHPRGREEPTPERVIDTLKEYFKTAGYGFSGGTYEEVSSKGRMNPFRVNGKGAAWEGYVECGYHGSSVPILSVILYDVSKLPPHLESLLAGYPDNRSLWRPYFLQTVPGAEECLPCVFSGEESGFGIEFPYPDAPESEHHVLAIFRDDGTASLQEEYPGSEVRGSWRRIALEIRSRFMRLDDPPSEAAAVRET